MFYLEMKNKVKGVGGAGERHTHAFHALFAQRARSRVGGNARKQIRNRGKLIQDLKNITQRILIINIVPQTVMDIINPAIKIFNHLSRTFHIQLLI